jgi:hypothetical protein
VAKSDKDTFNFDDFQYSGVKLSPVPDFKLEEDPTTSPAVVEPVEVVDATAGLSEAPAPLEAVPEKGKKKAKKEKPAKVKKTRVPAEAAVAKTPSDFRKKLLTTNPFTVFLGLTVLMLFMAVVFLLIELSRYDFDTKATKGKQSVVMNERLAIPLEYRPMHSRGVFG